MRALGRFLLRGDLLTVDFISRYSRVELERHGSSLCWLTLVHVLVVAGFAWLAGHQIFNNVALFTTIGLSDFKRQVKFVSEHLEIFEELLLVVRVLIMLQIKHLGDRLLLLIT